MSTPDEGNVDAADIEVTQPPSGWTPDLVDALPDPQDVMDADEAAND